MSNQFEKLIFSYYENVAIPKRDDRYCSAVPLYYYSDVITRYVHISFL